MEKESKECSRQLEKLKQSQEVGRYLMSFRGPLEFLSSHLQSGDCFPGKLGPYMVRTKPKREGATASP